VAWGDGGRHPPRDPARGFAVAASERGIPRHHTVWPRVAPRNCAGCRAGRSLLHHTRERDQPAASPWHCTAPQLACLGCCALLCVGRGHTPVLRRCPWSRPPLGAIHIPQSRVQSSSSRQPMGQLTASPCRAPPPLSSQTRKSSPAAGDVYARSPPRLPRCMTCRAARTRAC